MAAFHEVSHRVYAPIVPDPVTSDVLYYLLVSVATFCALIQAYRFIDKDYHAFLSLGPGGTPSTFQGYLRISWLRLHAHKNPFLPPALTPQILPSAGYLLRLPRRVGLRPRVAGIAPHRQTDQIPPRALSEGMVGALHILAGAYPTWIRTGVSCFEEHGLALFLTATVALQRFGAEHLNETCRNTGEICHLHSTVSISLLCEHTGCCCKPVRFISALLRDEELQPHNLRSANLAPRLCVVKVPVPIQ